MKRTIFIFVLLTTAAAMGSTLQDQKACYVQAKKVAETKKLSDDRQFRNHFDGTTCWVEVWTDKTSYPNGWAYSVYNAFEPQSPNASFSRKEHQTTPDICYVGFKKCHSMEEFDALSSQKYGW